MLSTAEKSALAVFRSFHVGAGQMLCFHGPQLAKHGASLKTLTEKNFVIKEQFAGGYSLTRSGAEAMAAERHSAARAAAAVARKPSARSQSARPR
jgi:hypothetical protein